MSFSGESTLALRLTGWRLGSRTVSATISDSTRPGAAAAMKAARQPKASAINPPMERPISVPIGTPSE